MVNVDTVYKTVLYILNKEQRGYITPDEFNRLSVQVQREIFEQYFEELNQQLRVPQNDSEYANRVKNLEERIDIFKKFRLCTGSNPFSFPDDLHKVGTLIFNDKEIETVNRNEYFLINKSPLTQPTTEYPLYVLEGVGYPWAAPSQAYVYPTTITSGVTAYYIKAPTDPRWGYIEDPTLGYYAYDSTKAFALVAARDMVGSITINTSDGVNGGYTGDIASTAGYTTDGYGSGARITVTVAGNTVTAIVVDGAVIGNGFEVGDTITVSQAVIGGTTDLVLTLQPADLFTNTVAYSTDFELHPSEQVNIILNILIYSGVVIRDTSIIQTAAQMVQQNEALEKS